IYIGLPIAVFGIRLLFQMLIVSVTSVINFMNVVTLALYNPQQYQAILDQSMPYICRLVSRILIKVFLNFFLSEKKGH
ncbi:DUF475 domain-containing protein, partial [Francisella tularensis subsp. holarctica]|uniref:DUF475 domain-containing protein n=1 Tax=Francisella tularensis TaxID=263 RepID=UPI00238195D5